jgi:SAM-dependent methyltransferase
VTTTKIPLKSGRDYYAGLYHAQLDLQGEWLRYGATEKVNSIETLIGRHGISPVTLLELGCGTGAVITECQRRKLGSEWTAIDYSSEAIGYLQSRAPDIRCVVADITDPGFTLEGSYDVVVLSHVLEHLEQPLKFLQSLISRIQFRYLIAEVPLEDLLGARIRNIFQDRYTNSAGHVQWFKRASFLELISSAMLDVTDERRYVPVLSPEVLDFVAKKDHQSGSRRLARRATACYLPRLLGPVWERAWYAHYAVLCVPSGGSQRMLTDSERGLHS